MSIPVLFTHNPSNNHEVECSTALFYEAADWVIWADEVPPHGFKRLYVKKTPKRDVFPSDALKVYYWNLLLRMPVMYLGPNNCQLCHGTGCSYGLVKCATCKGSGISPLSEWVPKPKLPETQLESYLRSLR